jgi:hypothetical protein
VSADEPAVGATWKLRVIVYGLLLVIGALVLAARPGDPSDPKPAALQTLRGTTSQGSRIALGMRGSHIQVLSVNHVDLRCGSQYSWQVTVGQARVRYWENGAARDILQQWPGNAMASMAARVYNGGHNIDGVFSLDSGRCDAAHVRFSASG